MLSQNHQKTNKWKGQIWMTICPSLYMQRFVKIFACYMQYTIYSWLCQSPTRHLHWIGACQEETTGENVTQGIFFWRATAGGGEIVVECPYGVKSRSLLTENTNKSLENNSSIAYKARRSCLCNNNLCQSPYWLEPETSQCKYRAYNDSEITEALSTLYQVCDRLMQTLTWVYKLREE